jgi:RNA polymerase sigma-70 factor (ECF subfamily)
MRNAEAKELASAFATHRRFLWSLTYRMLGCAADADDVVQETFVRASAHPPRELEELRPWLTRVAMNVARDALRRRRRAVYDGPWLPSPIDTADESPDAPARYAMLESASYAFLLALEALSPPQRAVLVLMDVFDYSVRECAEALEITEANVKVTHHRARKRMAGYDASRRPPTAERKQAARAALEKFFTALVTRDVAAAEAMLAADCVAITDGGGVYHAARVPIVGPAKVALFYSRLTILSGTGARIEVRELNGLPAMVASLPGAKPGFAPLVTIRIDLDHAGRIARVYSVQNPRKLTAITAP